MKLNKYIKKLCKNMQDTKRNLVLLNYKIPIRAPQFLEKTFFPHNSVDINLLLYLAFLCDFFLTVLSNLINILLNYKQKTKKAAISIKKDSKERKVAKAVFLCRCKPAEML